MQFKISSPRRVLLIAVFTGLVALSPALLIYFASPISIHRGSALIIENAAALPSQEQVTPPVQESSDLPVRLKIPGINVDSAVEYVGLTPDRAMDVPQERSNVAWFNLGPRPGESGTAVMAGHYGGKASVFDNLYKLRKGDKIYVEDGKGATTTFVVRESRRYDPKADASDVFGSNYGKSHLNLITCEGAWNKVSKSYPERLVVFTDRE